MKNLDLNAMGVMEMKENEVIVANGGHVPMDYYMDRATMEENGKLLKGALQNFLTIISFF